MIRIIDKASDWSDLLNSCKFHTCFDTWEWGEIVNNNYGFKPIHLLLDDSFILPSFEIRWRNKKFLISNPIAEYGGLIPLSNQSDQNEIFQQLINVIHYFNCTLKFAIHPFNNNLSLQIKNPNLKINSELCTYILNMNSSYENIKKGFHRLTRRSIKIAERNELKIEELRGLTGNSLSKINELYSIYLHTCKRNQSLPMSLKFLKDLSKSEMCTIYKISTKEDKAISCMFFLEYNNVYHSYIGATYDRFLPLAPVYFIYNEVIKDLCEKGNCYIDFGSARKGTSLESFKNKWNADRYDILRYTNDEGNFDISNLSNIRKLWGKMPEIVIRYLGPNLLRYTL